MKTNLLAALAVFTATVSNDLNSYAQTAAKPNVIFIYTDDQRFDALSVVQNEQGKAARFPWFKTPNLDRLAAEGVRFRNSFVTNSLCSPSRSAFLTGKYNHLNGIANNHTELTDTTVTYATELKKSGYKTGFFGKWHMGKQTGKRQGFDYSASFIGQGQYFDCPLEVNGKQTATIGWVDDVTTDYALQFIRQNNAAPFALALAFKSGHGPFQPATRHAKDYSDVLLTKPATEQNLPPYLGKIDVGRPNQNNQQNNNKLSNSWTENNDDRVRNYFRCLAGVDENVGRVLNLLDSLKLTENTIVIFTSDNGFFLGEHGVGDKRAAYEESIRTPLLVRYPKLIPKGKTEDKLVLNLDIAPTILDAAGVKAPKSFQGQSLIALETGKAKDWRKSFLYEYFYENNFALPTIEAVRTETAKLIKYPGQEEWNEVYDLTKDPNESNNLYNTAAGAALKKSLESELKKQEAAVGFTIPAYADKAPLDENGKYINPKSKVSL